MNAIIALTNVNQFTSALFTAMFLYLMIISNDSKFQLRCAGTTHHQTSVSTHQQKAIGKFC